MIVAVVHAKESSLRLPRKNFLMLGNKPLIAWAIETALRSDADKVIIDSESDKLLKLGEQYGATPLKRPHSLANNSTTGDDLAYWQASNFPDSDVIIQVVPTSPFTKISTVNKCINAVLYKKNSAFTANRERLYTWGWGGKGTSITPNYYDYSFVTKEARLLNSNELEETIVEYPGVYAFSTKFALENKMRIDITSFIMVDISPIEKIDINYQKDLDFARVIANGLASYPY